MVGDLGDDCNGPSLMGSWKSCSGGGEEMLTYLEHALVGDMAGVENRGNMGFREREVSQTLEIRNRSV